MNKELENVGIMAKENPTPLEALTRIEINLHYNNWWKYRKKDLDLIEKHLKALEIVKDLIYIDVNNQVRLKPKDKTLTATKSLDEEKAILLKEVLHE